MDCPAICGKRRCKIDNDEVTHDIHKRKLEINWKNTLY